MQQPDDSATLISRIQNLNRIADLALFIGTVILPAPQLIHCWFENCLSELAINDFELLVNILPTSHFLHFEQDFKREQRQHKLRIAESGSSITSVIVNEPKYQLLQSATGNNTLRPDVASRKQGEGGTGTTRRKSLERWPADPRREQSCVGKAISPHSYRKPEARQTSRHGRGDG